MKEPRRARCLLARERVPPRTCATCTASSNTPERPWYWAAPEKFEMSIWRLRTSGRSQSNIVHDRPSEQRPVRLTATPSST